MPFRSTAAARLLLALAAVFSATTALAAPDEGSGDACVVKGRPVLEKGLTLFSAREGGIALASFTSQEVALEASDFPSDPNSRVKVKTGKSFRIEGFLDAQKVPLSTRRDVAVARDHVWIAQGEPLKFRGASPGKVSVETTIYATSQKLKAKAACGDLGLGKMAASDLSAPSGPRRFVLRSTTLELFEEPGGASIFTVEVPTAGSGILLFGGADKSGHVRVEHRSGPLVIDAWARLADLKPFPKSELLDVVSPPTVTSLSPAKLKFDGSVKEVKTTKEVPLRLSASDAAKPIGVIEDGAEIIILDTVAGWSRVYPKGLEIVPPEGKDFWAKAADVDK